jgi:hypothetical protein
VKKISYGGQKVRIGFFLYKTTALSKWINYDEIIRLLEFDNRVPFLSGGDLLHTLLYIAAIEPKVKSLLLKVDFYADHSRCSSSELLSDLFF